MLEVHVAILSCVQTCNTLLLWKSFFRGVVICVTINIFFLFCRGRCSSALSWVWQELTLVYLGVRKSRVVMQNNAAGKKRKHGIRVAKFSRAGCFAHQSAD